MLSFLASIYFIVLILGTLCAFDSPTEQSHHHGRTVSHSASCLLACAATVTDRTQMVPLTLSLLFIGTVLTFRKTLPLNPFYCGFTAGPLPSEPYLTFPE
ncbi:MAG: hypothetical protein MPW17_22640 (plasmid) [Candidatus Manganitrophus sp.]|nr:MAG: hypothetical protein MPW17_22640 [Candidatus Manganitrophus sp.]